ncbi:MAG TPA: SHOCT domain-containing protein [Ideonella sp.]|uniref:SHOCT domain-containing protein n=1 Tax=Ideonella sp. TaxID=1929293 RepID=UPI002CDAB895|nr:SHOCT domain-containing protein [Ideonella sp.]HSI48812.1 SHOCT domain-containing protein [Ideonella sp.]
MKTKLSQTTRAVLLAGTTIAAVAPVHAGIAPLFSAAQQAASSASKGPRLWTVGEYSEVRLVPIEAGAPPNQHPARVPTELLFAQLRAIRTPAASADVPLFSDSELKDLVDPLSRALATASPSDDVVFVSSARRDDGSFFAPIAVTARLFVANGALQLIVHDARFDFFDRARGTHTRPAFEFGSRAAPGSAKLQSASAAAKRSDWLEMPLAMPAAVAPAAAVPSTAPAAAASPAPRAREAVSADEAEQRLLTLKRLRERGLISEEEYQQKRKEILSLL